MNVREIEFTGQAVAVVGLCPKTLRLTLFAFEILAGHAKVDERENTNGKLPVSGLGQSVNFEIPSKAVEVVTFVGLVHDNDSPETDGAELAVIVIWKELTVDPSVNVKVAVPELVKVTANGVLIEEVVILAPVKFQRTTVVEVIFVLF